MSPKRINKASDSDSDLESACLLLPSSASGGSEGGGGTWTNGKGGTWRHSSGLLAWAITATSGNIVLLFVLIGLGIPPSTVPFFPGPILTALRESTAHELPRGNQTEAKCSTPDFPLEGPTSDWYTLKAIPPPEPCLTRGMVIDKLEPEYNFRRHYTLGIREDMDDKAYLLPYLRPIQDRTMASRRRRVLLDLGGNRFNSSTLWFLRNYPLSFSEIHVFEVEKDLFKIPLPDDIPTDLLERLSNASLVPGAGSLPLPSDALNSITLHEALVGTEDKEVQGNENQPPSVDITRFMVGELGLTRNDAVVVKMDIEWAEWDVLKEWMSMPEMPFIVDELFVEVHYQHASMSVFGWNEGPTRDDATALFQELRTKGFFAHPWP